MVEILAVIVPLYVLVALGVAAGRMRAFGNAAGALNAFIYWFALPAFIFDLIMRSPDDLNLPLSFMLIPLLGTALFAVVIWAFAWFTGNKRRAGQIAMAGAFGNVGYFAFPVILSVLGQQIALAMAVANIIHNLIFMIGYPIYASLTNREEGQLRRALIKAVPTNPIILSVLPALIVLLLGWELPEILLAPITLLGQSVIPVAMFTIGLSLAPAIKELLRGGFSFSVLSGTIVAKLIGLPVATWVLIQLFAPDMESLLQAVLILMAASPTSVSSFTFVEEFESDGRFVAAVIAVTTALALVTVTAIGGLIG